ncbi:MAG: tRNA (cytidine(34)-2'-O)-methyltransferase [Caulobacteraceae bacterium]
MRLALFQPDIPQNVGAAMRLGACLGVPLDIIEPCGFPLSDKSLKRAAMDYAGAAEVCRHDGWESFMAGKASGARLVLFTTRSAVPYPAFDFQPSDVLLFGRESAGAPDFVHEAAAARLVIPLRPGLRSINVVNAAAMALGEALRQTNGFLKP